MLYASFALGHFSLAYMFPACFLAGASVVVVGLVVYIWPISLKGNKLADHSTYTQIMSEERDKKRVKVYEFICLGIAVIILTGTIQMLLSVIL